MKKDSQDHRRGLTLLYNDQLRLSGPFMTIVLTEAIRKLNETEIKPSKIEKWVIRLEKDFRNIKL